MIARKSVRKHPGGRCAAKACIDKRIPIGADYWFVPATKAAYHQDCLPVSYREVRA